MEIITALNVWMEHFDKPIGDLGELENGDVFFLYRDEYLKSDHFIPLSRSLPKSEFPFADHLTRSFFDNLLQENTLLDEVKDREGLDRGDLVGLLNHLGGDLAGALSCIPLGQDRVKIPGSLRTDYNAIDNETFKNIVNALADRKGLPDQVKDPSPIAGAQRKIAITVLEDGRFAFPKKGLYVPTTHILKVPKRNRGIEAYEEKAAAVLASQCGMDVVVPEVIEVDGLTALLIPRYDRKIDSDGNVSRIHQEDFLQALGLPHSLKYERKGKGTRKFDVDKIVNVLKDTKLPSKSMNDFLLSVFFNLAIGNTDNHAKNYSLLYLTGDVPVLAPLYDLLPIKTSTGYCYDLAFNIGGKSFFDDIKKEDYLKLLLKFNLKGSAAERFIENEVRKLLENIERNSLTFDKPKLKSFQDLIGRELEQLNEVLGLNLVLTERDYFVPDVRG